jgi:hypothetical protein
VGNGLQYVGERPRALKVPNTVRKTDEAVVILVAALVGVGLGTCVASMIGASLPDSRHRRFEKDFAAGRILLMIDAPLGRAVELRGLLLQRVPGTVDGGVELAIPAYP